MSDSEEELERHIKIVFLGDPCVGKTCLALRYCNNSFTKQYFPTNGVEFLLKRETLQKTKNVTLRIWDIGGASIKMLDKYIFNANVVAFVYDVTNEESFLGLPRWVETVRSYSSTTGDPPHLSIIGNKCDMEHQRVVKQDRQSKLAAELRVGSHVTSARTGEGVALAFQRMMADFMGLRLSRNQVEEFQKVVRAEISTYSTTAVAAPSKIPVSSSSSVCALQ